ncbi:MAG: hydrolase [Marinobacter sp.]|uniref:hydrolase n=1 Tax=Marinobacter sp. TaxID=50741 RepID=UPI00396D63EF
MVFDPKFQPGLDWIDSRQDAMLQQTIALAEVNSGSLNAEGVNRVGQMLAEHCQHLGGQVEVVPVASYRHVSGQGKVEEFPLGNAIRVRKRPEAPLQIFLCGHLDTVFPKDHSFQKVSWLDDNTLNGPGVADLKGGLVVMLTALEALERSSFSDRIGWEILFNPDEEIGSPSSAKLITEAAERVHLGMIYEPSFPDGNLAGQRKGSGNFSVVVRGRAAHAGREHHFGRNAIRAMADFVSALDSLNGQRDGVTINPGYIEGGGPVNIVPDLCVFRFNIRLERAEDEAWCQAQLDHLLAATAEKDGFSIELHGGFGRKPKQLSQANLRLFELARQCGDSLGMRIEHKPTGGCCDGNNLAAAGIPNIDTLGVQGGAIHSSDEYMKVDSLVQRAKLSALMLMELATSPDLDWLGVD